MRPLIEELPRHYQRSPQDTELQRALGTVLDRARADLELTVKQLIPSTASGWGLELWEEAYALTPDPSLDAQSRTRRLLSKVRGTQMTTVERIRSLAEQYTRSFNYPDEGCVKTRADLPRLGIKTFFASDVCCAYDREKFWFEGGFISPAIFNEDMIFAGKAVLEDDYAVAYAAQARVYHSHNYTCMQQFRRYFDLAVSQKDHPEVFSGLRPEGEGIRLVKETAGYLIRSGRGLLVFKLVIDSGCKYMGYLAGKRYKRLPRWLILRCTMNRNYWRENYV